MKLSKEELAEVSRHIHTLTRYKETYDEIYDHVINVLEEREGAFNSDMVSQILRDDFGGDLQIIKNETICLEELNRGYSRSLMEEIFCRFGYPQLMNNILLLCFCLLFYFEMTANIFDTIHLINAVFIFLCYPFMRYLYYTYFVNRNLVKPTMKNVFLLRIGLCGCFLSVLLYFLLLSQQSFFEISNHTRTIICMVTYYCTSVYIRSFDAFYKKKIKVFA